MPRSPAFVLHPPSALPGSALPYLTLPFWGLTTVLVLSLSLEHWGLLPPLGLSCSSALIWGHCLWRTHKVLLDTMPSTCVMCVKG